MADQLTVRASHQWFGGELRFYEHQSKVCQSKMRFSAYVPPGEGPFPVLYWLSGLTCTEENFMAKSGIAPLANEHGIMVVAPDTSPRGCEIKGEDDAWDFGTGAGFYVNATEAGWSDHYNMYDYVSAELPALVRANLADAGERSSISGHSMGGHGAMVIGTRLSERYASVSAFAPIAHPTIVPWGKKAFSGYLGPDESAWRPYDTVCLFEAGQSPNALLVDYGEADPFLKEQLSAGELKKACNDNSISAEIRMRPGYDHSYYFVSTFLPDHLRFHAKHLR